MNRKLVAIVLIGSFLISACRFTIPFASFYANYAYFSSPECLQMCTPYLHHIGKYQLKRMIKNIHDFSVNNNKAKVDHSVKRDFFCSQLYVLLTHPFRNHAQTLYSINMAVHSQYFAEPASPPPRFS